MLLGRSRLAYYAVFDGHAGARAAQWSAEHLHQTLAEKFPRGMTGRRQTCTCEFFTLYTFELRSVRTFMQVYLQLYMVQVWLELFYEYDLSDGKVHV